MRPWVKARLLSSRGFGYGSIYHRQEQLGPGGHRGRHKFDTLRTTWKRSARQSPATFRPVAWALGISAPTVGFMSKAAPSQQLRLTVDTESMGRLVRRDPEGAHVAIVPSTPVLEVPLSPSTLRAREKVLRAITESYQRSTVLQQPDGALIELVVEGGAIADLSGALTLLLECGGQEEQVALAGGIFLKGNTSNTPKTADAVRDVALCTALAHKRLASQTLEGRPLGSKLPDFQTAVRASAFNTPGGAQAAYNHVTQALKVLADHTRDSTPGILYTELMEMMLGLVPAYTKELLTPAPGAKQLSNQQRERAVEVVKGTLSRLTSSQQRGELMGQVRSMFTAVEQIALYDGSTVPPELMSEQELYDQALAHIWEGYTKRWPHHVYHADTLLAEIASRTDLYLDVTLERNVCALLLGKRHEAQGQLVPGTEGLAGAAAAGAASQQQQQQQQGKTGSAPSQDKKNQKGAVGRDQAQHHARLGARDSAFVVVDSLDEGEELSALESWAERWLELSVAPSFQPQEQRPAAAAASTAAAAAGPPSRDADAGAGAVMPHPVSVKAYLSSPKVMVFNQVLRHANERNMRHVLDNLQHMSHASLQQLLGLFRSSSATPKQPEQQQAELPGAQPATSSPPQAAATAADATPAPAAPAGEKALDVNTARLSVDPADRPAAHQVDMEALQAAIARAGGMAAEDAAAAAAAVVGSSLAPSHQMLGSVQPDDDPAAVDSAAAAAAEEAAVAAVAKVAAEAAVKAELADQQGKEVSEEEEEPRLWVRDDSGKIRPRVVARIVDPQQKKHGSRNKGGLATIDRLLLQSLLSGALQTVVVMGMAAAAWWGAKQVVRSGILWSSEVPVVVHVLPSARASAVQVIAEAQASLAGEAKGMLTPAAAEKLLLGWQAAQAAALGPSRSHDLLPLMLEGQALRQARQDARDMQRRGQHVADVTASVRVLDIEADMHGEVRMRAAVSRSWLLRGRSGSPEVREVREEVVVQLRRLPAHRNEWRITAVSSAAVL